MVAVEETTVAEASEVTVVLGEGSLNAVTVVAVVDDEPKIAKKCLAFVDFQISEFIIFTFLSYFPLCNLDSPMLI